MSEAGDIGEVGNDPLIDGLSSASRLKDLDTPKVHEVTLGVARSIHNSIELEESSKDPSAWLLRQVNIKEGVNGGTRQRKVMIGERIVYMLQPPAEFRTSKGIEMVYLEIGDRTSDAGIKFLEQEKNTNPYGDLDSHDYVNTGYNSKKKAMFVLDVADVYKGIKKHGIRKEAGDFTVKRPDAEALSQIYIDFIEGLPFTNGLVQSPQGFIDQQISDAQAEIDGREETIPSAYSSPELDRIPHPDGFFTNSDRNSFYADLARRMEKKKYGIRVVDETYDIDGNLLHDMVAISHGTGEGGSTLLSKINDTPEAKVLKLVKESGILPSKGREVQAIANSFFVILLPDTLSACNWPPETKLKLGLMLERAKMWAASDLQKLWTQLHPEEPFEASRFQDIALDKQKSAEGFSMEGVEPLSEEEIDKLIDELIEREKVAFRER